MTPDSASSTNAAITRSALLVTAVLVTAIGLSLFVLTGALDDTAWLRGVLVGALVLALVTLLVRIGFGRRPGDAGAVTNAISSSPPPGRPAR